MKNLILKTNKTNLSHLCDFIKYKHNKINKNYFLKNKNKKIIYFKKKSSIKDNFYKILHKFYNISNYSGGKENFFKNFNKFLKIFNFIFNKNNNYFKKYLENKIYFNNNKNNFNFSFFIYNVLKDFYLIFDLKTIKLNKKTKVDKKKYDLNLIYLTKNKRLKNILKIINLEIRSKKEINLLNNIYWVFNEIFFDYYESFLWKRKLKVYSMVINKKKKKILS